MAAGENTVTLQRRTVLLAAMASASLAGTANAFAGPCPVDLTVVDRETGRPLRVWRHDGRMYVAGQPGARYGLRVTNRTEARVLVVMSVDGVNIVSGETAGFGQRGYIFGPHEAYDVTGWRKSTSEVADFTFAPLPQSYAARTGRPDDVGVIGLAVFDERRPVEVSEAEAPARAPIPLALPHAAADRQDAAAGGADNKAATVTEDVVVAAQKREQHIRSAPVAVSAYTSQHRDLVAAERPDEKLGTGHGAREWSVANEEPFERATPDPRYIQQIEYDTYDNLVASGVIPSWRRQDRPPRPFPSSPDQPGYVPDPPRDP